MRGRGKRVATGAAILGLVVLAATVLAVREDIAWWWRTRDAAQVSVLDYITGRYRLEGPAMVAHAREATRRFIESVRAKPRAAAEFDGGQVSYVAFLPPDGPVKDSLSVQLIYLDFRDESVAVDFLGVRYICTVSDWVGYLRDLLRPIKALILTTWRDLVTDPEDHFDERFNSAVALALLVPETDGLVEFFCDDISNNVDHRDGGVFYLYFAIRSLGEMGPAAVEAVPVLVAAQKRTEHECIRAAAGEALKRIKGEKP